LQQNLPDEVNSKLRDIYDDNLRTVSMVDNILSVSRISSGMINVAKQSKILSTVLDPILAKFKPVLEEKQLQLVLEYQPVELGNQEIPLDVANVNLVIENLIMNSIKYNKPHGSIAIKVVKESDSICISVSDTGIGIAPDEQPLVFDRFYRGKNAIETGIDGTGLGLFVVKSLVTAWGGTIHLQSNLDQGTVITICIPQS
jgi:signal transduction histidine kinase